MLSWSELTDVFRNVLLALYGYGRNPQNYRIKSL
nr:MAG TPA: hypothetical protein [Bacteriophage sp.]